MSIKASIKNLLFSIHLKKEAVLNPVMFGSLLEGRTAVITGGTSGIGLEIARAYARNGASVIITGRTETRINSAVEAIKCSVEGARATGVVFDNSERSGPSFDGLFERASNAIGGDVDILVNNAGVLSDSPISKVDIAEFDRVINTNLRGTYFLSQAFAQRLVFRGRPGNILNICSSSSLRPALSPYTVSKWGVRGLTLGLAKALIQHGIVVNGLAPGPTATPMLIREGDGNLSHQKVPAGRYASAEEIANMAVILVSDLSRMVVGDIIYMTGGAGNLTLDDIDYSLFE